MSTFLALYGYHPPSITSLVKGNIKAQEVEDYIGNQQKVPKPSKEKFVGKTYLY
jgi:hypothetical protein